MPTIVDGVDFNVIAREWCCKWSFRQYETSLKAAQKALDAVWFKLISVDGILGVQRVFGGGCCEFKVIISMRPDKFDYWNLAEFAPEEEFFAKIKESAGVVCTSTSICSILAFSKHIDVPYKGLLQKKVTKQKQSKQFKKTASFKFVKFVKGKFIKGSTAKARWH